MFMLLLFCFTCFKLYDIALNLPCPFCLNLNVMELKKIK